MRRIKALAGTFSDIIGGYAPAFFAAGVVAYSLDPVSKVLIFLALTVAYVLRAPQVTDQNYLSFLAGYFTAAAGLTL
jgi:hypothetical protein